MQDLIEEDFAQAYILCDYKEQLGDLLPELHMQVLRDVNLDDPPHILFLY